MPETGGSVTSAESSVHATDVSPIAESAETVKVTEPLVVVAPDGLWEIVRDGGATIVTGRESVPVPTASVAVSVSV